MTRNTSIDLHVHSTFSDGRLTPVELAKLAVWHNITAIAITDHDTMAGSREKKEACLEHDIECVLGVELSCELDGREAHILALFIDPDSPVGARIKELSLSRISRMTGMLERLRKMGIDIALDDLPVAADGVHGRPHLARAMVEKGVVRNVGEAFARYLHDFGPVHIDKQRLSAKEGIALAKELGGVSILAHPGVSGWRNELDAFVEIGLDGVEVYHPKHSGEAIAMLLRHSRERGLLVSGGSDFHGKGEGSDLGSARVPVDVLEPLRCLAMKRNRRHGIF